MGLDRSDAGSSSPVPAALFLCTLAGQKVFAGEKADVEQLASEVPVPPKVQAAEARRRGAPPPTLVARPSRAHAASTGSRPRPVRWNIVPTGRDAMMDKKVKGQDEVRCLRLPPLLSPGSRAPLGPATIPGPADRGRDRRHDRRQLPQQDRHAGDDPPARRLLLAGDGRRLQGPATPIPAASCRRSRRSSTSGRPARGPRASGSTTTTGRWTRCRSTRGCSGRC